VRWWDKPPVAGEGRNTAAPKHQPHEGPFSPTGGNSCVSRSHLVPHLGSPMSKHCFDVLFGWRPSRQV
jgi:hypothetical protein